MKSLFSYYELNNHMGIRTFNQLYDLNLLVPAH